MEQGPESAPATGAPPVVAVVVAFEPGEEFEECLHALARQDYPDLKTLVLLTGDSDGVAERIRPILPDAFVEQVAGNPGFGPAANEVLRLVQGDNGLFCFLHDDVALDPTAIRLMVEEVYRSNAGVVGPKLVEWDVPTVLQHVGYAVDRFGEVDPIVERGEVDQEQHDAVRDVFALPSACMLVRADLFRTLDGFDPTMSFHGEDLDLCWRAHRSGARVLVAPAARGRHVEALVERRPDLPHETLRARHRVRSVLTLTAARRLPLVAVELVAMTVAELVVGLFTGRLRSGVAGVRAVVGTVPRAWGLFRRRRAVGRTRHVPDRDVARLQMRDSARFAAFARSRGSRGEIRSERGDERRWRERAGASSFVAWAGVIAALVVGSRHLLTGGVPAFGEFLPFGDSPRRLLRSYLTDWSDVGLGGRRAAPTGLALISFASVATLFRMGLLHTLAVIGLLVAGCAGMWRLSTAFATNRARIVALVVYALVPLPGQMISVGRWGALVTYAALPWAVDGMCRFAGIGTGSTASAGELVVRVSVRRRVQVTAVSALTAAVAIAFEPGYAVVLVVAGILIAAATALAGTGWRASLHVLSFTALSTALALVLNLPWISSFAGDGGWTAIVGPASAGDRGNSMFELASFELGNLRGVGLALALYVPVLAAPLLGRGWRHAWGLRAGALVAGFVWLAVLDDGGSLPLRLPEPGVVLVPVALALALAAACTVAAFELDVRGGTFGWRQPLGVVAGLAIGVGLLPGLYALTSGRWETPSTTMIDLLGQLPATPEDGDYRVLWVGDQRVVPAAGVPYQPGITYALTDNRSLEITETWGARPVPADDRVVEALDAIATGSTARAGRLLAPFAVRYIVIPVTDGAVSTADEPVPVPAGLLDALGDQLDLAEVYSPPNIVVYENRAWLPSRSVLTAAGADASRVAGAAALAQADIAGGSPVLLGSDEITPRADEIPAGTLHVAEPFDGRWTLTVDGEPVEARPAFGATIAYDVERAGDAVLAYESTSGRSWALAAQGLGWVIVVLAAMNVSLPRWRRTGGRTREPVEPLMTLGSGAPATSAEIAPSDAEVPVGATSTSEPAP